MPIDSLNGQANIRKTYKEKARESVPVTRPAYRGLRIAHPVRTSNAEAHADMHSTRYTFLTSKAYQEYINISRRHPLLLCFDRVLEIAKFYKPKTKRQVNVFPIYITLTQSPSAEGYRHKKRCKYKKKRRNVYFQQEKDHDFCI